MERRCGGLTRDGKRIFGHENINYCKFAFPLQTPPRYLLEEVLFPVLQLLPVNHPLRVHIERLVVSERGRSISSRKM
jgi:hypothetical protein